MNISSAFGIPSANTSGAASKPDTSAAGRNSGGGDAVQNFLDYAKETPAQRMRDSILKSLGVSEADLKAMDSAKRKAIEDMITKKIKDAAEDSAKSGKTGLVADVTA